MLRRLEDPRLASPSHLILVHGFDYPPEGAVRDLVCERIGRVAEALEMSLVEVETNLRRLNDPYVPWGGLQHGSLLAAVGLSMSAGFGRVLIPATNTYDTLYAWGTHPFTDPLWSTEVTGFIHDGPEATRVEKVAWQIARSNLALEHLRVCFENPAEAYNCSRCGKCQRTMIALQLAGALERAKTFRGEPDPALLSGIDTSDPAVNVQTRWALEELECRGLDPEIRRVLRDSLRPRPRNLARTARRRAGPSLRMSRDRHLPWARLSR